MTELDKIFSIINSSTGGGAVVNRTTAMRLSAVYACVNAIACDLAGLPAQVFKKTGNKVEKVKDHPAYDKIKLNPNPEMRAYDFHRVRRTHTLLTGNSYTLIEIDGQNQCKNLWPLDPDKVKIERITRQKGIARGELRYVFKDGNTIKSYKPENILHLKAFTWNGTDGQSVITNYAKQQIGIGLEMDEFQAAFLRNGLNPGGIFKHPKTLGEKQKPTFLGALKKRFGGSKNRGEPMVLEDGMDYVPFEVKMVDQQFLELLKLTAVNICGIFGVPQSRIGISDSNTNYNNSEQEKRRYYESGLLPWAIPDEQEMTFKLLTPAERASGMYIKYNFSAFLRGDSKTRAEVSRIWSTMGVPVNDLLELEDGNPVEGGDTGLVQINMIPLKDLESFVQNKQAAPAQNNKRSLENRSIETRSFDQIVSARDRVRARFIPLLTDALEKVVNRENVAVSREIKKHLTERSKEDFSKFLDEFYQKFPEYIDKNVRNVFLSYMETMQEVVAGEVNIEPDFTSMLDEARNYIDGYVRQYVDSSRGQIISLMEEEDLEAVQTRVEDWREKRTDKELSEVSVGIGSFVARSVILGAGFRLVWKIRGADTCPLCKKLNKRTVTKSSQPFTDENEDFTDEKGNKTNFRRTLYSPLHRGCDCVVVAG